MKALSDACEYALRAVVWLADHPDMQHPVQRIARATQTSPGYLARIMQQLRRAGLVRAQRGLHGGFSLRQDPRQISILDVINAVDPLERIRVCPLGIEAHSRILCPLHRRIDGAIQQMEQTFASTNVAELVSEAGASRPLFDPDQSTEGEA